MRALALESTTSQLVTVKVLFVLQLGNGRDIHRKFAMGSFFGVDGNEFADRAQVAYPNGFEACLTPPVRFSRRNRCEHV